MNFKRFTLKIFIHTSDRDLDFSIGLSKGLTLALPENLGVESICTINPSLIWIKGQNVTVDHLNCLPNKLLNN
ncbi:hypothetical protein BLOT_000794 [Blomia tropicalis]|nr:hypothetical protein BLOT_000794 [Blomia tropicalis]